MFDQNGAFTSDEILEKDKDGTCRINFLLVKTKMLLLGFMDLLHC